MSGLGLTFLRRGGQAHPTAGSDYIKFKDEAVFNILMSKGVSSDGVGITKDDAAKVTSIGTWFRANTNITSFDEFGFFTSVASMGTAAASNSSSPFFGCTNLQSIVIPDGMEMVGAYSFAECPNLRSVKLSLSIKTLYARAFYRVPAKMIVDLPLLSSTLQANTFFESGVERIENLGSITSIGGGWNQGCFQGCTNLVFARLPKTLIDIGGYAFQTCTALKVVICEAVNPPTLAGNNNGLGNADIYVPDTSIDAYKGASGWSSYASRIKGISEYNG